MEVFTHDMPFCLCQTDAVNRLKLYHMILELLILVNIHCETASV